MSDCKQVWQGQLGGQLVHGFQIWRISDAGTSTPWGPPATAYWSLAAGRDFVAVARDYGTALEAWSLDGATCLMRISGEQGAYFSQLEIDRQGRIWASDEQGLALFEITGRSLLTLTPADLGAPGPHFFSGLDGQDRAWFWNANRGDEAFQVRMERAP